MVTIIEGWALHKKSQELDKLCNKVKAKINNHENAETEISEYKRKLREFAANLDKTGSGLKGISLVLGGTKITELKDKVAKELEYLDNISKPVM
jgi:hypothetical protein